MNDILRIGTTPSRVEDLALLADTGKFFDRRPRLLHSHLIVIRSSLPHALVRAVDLSAALAIGGVDLGLVAGDLPNNGPLPAIDLTEASADAHQTILAADRVRYVGEPIAVLAGDDLETLEVAARLVRIELEPLPALASIDRAIAPDAARLRDGMGNGVHVLSHLVGDPDAAFAAAEQVIEGSFRFHRVAAMPLEPRAVEAWPDPDGLHVTATTQIPGAARLVLANLLGLPAEAVHYEPVSLGGGFGCREAFYAEEVLVAEAARRLNRRVRWQETRREHFIATAHGREGKADLRMAFDGHGIVSALAVTGYSDIGAGYSYAGNSPGAAMGAMVRGPYRIPHHRATTTSVTTNKTPLNVYRGAGHPQAVFAMERMMDRAASASGIDRVEIRRRNLIASGSFPLDRGVSYPGAGRIIYDSGDFEHCLDTALEAIGHAAFSARKRAWEAQNPHSRLGFGLSLLVELTSTGPDETVLLSVDAGGQFTIETAVVEMGQRTISALTQVLSDKLSLPAGRIAVHCGRPLPGSGGGSFASRGAAVVGAAVADGAARLIAAALGLAADRFGVPLTSIAWRDGGIAGLPRHTSPLDLGELMSLCGRSELKVTGEFVVPASTFASACHAAVVAVDVETGVIDVLDYAVAHDCGRVLNPAGVDAQIVGGVMQGIGATLCESIAYDPDAMPLTSSLMDYPLPVAAQVPRFHLRHIETPSPVNPLGFKGAGEGGFVGVPASLASAIEDALSEFAVTLDDDGPYTPSRVLGLLRNASLQPISEST